MTDLFVKILLSILLAINVLVIFSVQLKVVKDKLKKRKQKGNLQSLKDKIEDNDEKQIVQLNTDQIFAIQDGKLENEVVHAKTISNSKYWVAPVKYVTKVKAMSKFDNSKSIFMNEILGTTKVNAQQHQG